MNVCSFIIYGYIFIYGYIYTFIYVYMHMNTYIQIMYIHVRLYKYVLTLVMESYLMLHSMRLAGKRTYYPYLHH
jgi:hypothetical protein